MIRWTIAASGAAVFLAAHGIEVVWWRDWFVPSGEFPPWFLNSARAVACTTMLMLGAAVVVGRFSRGTREALIAAGNLTAGGIASMIVVLFVSGPGSLFPIALAMGSVLLAAPAFAGVLLGAGVGGALRKP